MLQVRYFNPPYPPLEKQKRSLFFQSKQASYPPRPASASPDGRAGGVDNWQLWSASAFGAAA